jgi:hypothetical protein
MPPQVPLHVRKALLARLAVEGAIEPLRFRFADRTLAVTRKIVRDIRNRTWAEYEAPNDQQPLDHFVRDSIDYVRAELNRSVPTDPAIADVIRQMDDFARRVSCTDCADPLPVCANGYHDTAVLDAKGLCIVPFRELFETAWQIVAAYCHWALGQASPSAVLSTDFSPKTVHEYLWPIQVSGDVDYQRPAIVRLKIGLKTFGWSAYLATPYVLVHECVHALGALVPRPATPDKDDPFGEGWIDRLRF